MEPSSSLIGRQQELTTVRALLADARGAVTITGPGGVGKSRLAIELAKDGPHVFCNVGGVRSVDELCTRVRLALEDGALERADVRAVTQAVRARPEVLWIFDECELAIPFVRELLTAVQQRVQGARVVVTSRVALGIPGEHLLELPTLRVPATSEDVIRSPAVALWNDCVRRSRAVYEPDAQELRSIVQIVQLLDGLPLAIELAAVRMRIFDASTLLAEIRQRFDVLRRTKGAEDSRHDTLVAAIAGSVETLGDETRTALALLSTMRGTFTASTAIDLIGALQGPSIDALDVLQVLRDHSLVSSAEESGRGRLCVIESVRQFMRSSIDAATHARCADLVVTHFGDVARKSLGDSMTQSMRVEAEQLAEVVRIVAGMDEPPPRYVDDAFDARVALFWTFGRTHEEELNEATRRCVANAFRMEERVSPRTRAAARFFDASVRLTNAPETLDRFVESLVRAKSAEAWELASLAARHAMNVYVHRGSAEGVATMCGELVALGPRLGPRTRAENVVHVASSLANSGVEADCHATLEALAQLRALSSPRFINVALQGMIVLQAYGHADAARRVGREALAALPAHGLIFLQGALLLRLGEVELDARRLDVADAHFADAVREGRAFYGDDLLGTYVPFAMAKRGIVAAYRGDYLGAMQSLLGALPLVPSEPAKAWMWCWLTWLFAVCQMKVECADAMQRLTSIAKDVPVAANMVALATAFARELLGEDVAAQVEAALVEVHRQAAHDATLRIFVAAIEELRAKHRATVDAAGPSWLVGNTGRGFVTIDGQEVPLTAQPLLGRLLLELGRSYEANPGEYVPAQRLIAVGWPGERMGGRSALLRLRTAAKRLRRLGLASLIESGSGGYRLGPRARIRLVDDSARFFD